ncbi:interleukin-31 receptor subunit alpha isoform X2 [Denticeps clupeoides]|uniref:interleukin-31 receptor subunit alpha isoform X2 n=1 Tax=Denticeps clupeoides TaxID=299321 RepID=UPI0010A3C984|nr:interleukin-31 receptor subunit alpha-like isoform X2 [Denticeps clupeoides]
MAAHMLCVLLLVAAMADLFIEARTCEVPKPECFKNTTAPDEDFICQWESADTVPDAIYTLHIRDQTENFKRTFDTGRSRYQYILIEDIRTENLVDIWVSADVGERTCNSTVISVILSQWVKYNAPKISTVSRSFGVLSVQCEKAEDKAAEYGIRYREAGEDHKAWETFETSNNITDSFKINLQNDLMYILEIRRRAKHIQHALWSKWTPISVPVEIRDPLTVTWHEEPHNLKGTRTIVLTWNPPANKSCLGGVKYNLSFFTCPCKKRERNVTITTTEYRLNVTYSSVKVSLYAINQMGSSRTEVNIPHVQLLENCTENLQKATNGTKNLCWEFYKWGNGELQLQKTKSKMQKLNPKKNLEEDFVRYYFFVHDRYERTHRTVFMCPVYRKQAEPASPPQNININVTTQTAEVCWDPIPVQQQRGFLKHYLIWISGDVLISEKVPPSQLCIPLENLTPGTEYNISVAGETAKGHGPNGTKTFQTLAEANKHTSLVMSHVIGWLAALTFVTICPFIFKRLQSKLPDVPSPVISPAVDYMNGQTMGQMKEEVHTVTLMQICKLDEGPAASLEDEGCVLLRGRDISVFESKSDNDEEEGPGEEDEDKDDEVTSLPDMCSCTFLNPNYKKQTLRITDNVHKDNDDERHSSVYRNSSFLELKLEPSLEGTAV